MLWSVVVWLLALGVFGVCSRDIFDVGDVLRGDGRSQGKRHEKIERRRREACCLVFYVDGSGRPLICRGCKADLTAEERFYMVRLIRLTVGVQRYPWPRALQILREINRTWKCCWISQLLLPQE